MTNYDQRLNGAFYPADNGFTGPIGHYTDGSRCAVAVVGDILAVTRGEETLAGGRIRLPAQGSASRSTLRWSDGTETKITIFAAVDEDTGAEYFQIRPTKAAKAALPQDINRFLDPINRSDGTF